MHYLFIYFYIWLPIVALLFILLVSVSVTIECETLLWRLTLLHNRVYVCKIDLGFRFKALVWVVFGLNEMEKNTITDYFSAAQQLMSQSFMMALSVTYGIQVYSVIYKSRLLLETYRNVSCLSVLPFQFQLSSPNVVFSSSLTPTGLASFCPSRLSAH